MFSIIRFFFLKNKYNFELLKTIAISKEWTQKRLLLQNYSGKAKYDKLELQFPIETTGEKFVNKESLSGFPYKVISWCYFLDRSNLNVCVTVSSPASSRRQNNAAKKATKPALSAFLIGRLTTSDHELTNQKPAFVFVAGFAVGITGLGSRELSESVGPQEFLCLSGNLVRWSWDAPQT